MLTSPARAEAQPRLLVHAGRLVDGISAAPREMVTVIVEGERIAEGVAGYRMPAAGERVLDLSDATVLPGFIDLHVHLGMETSPSACVKQFTQDEVDAIVKTARDYDMSVAVHAHGAEGMKRAIRAGVDSIEHGTQMDDEAIRLFKEKRVWYVPTLTAGIFVGEKAKIPGYLPEVVRPKAALIGAQIRATAAKAVQVGVPIAFGTDAGVGVYGENGKEFGYLVEAGMTPMQAIQAATSSAAKVLHAEKDLGSVEKGKLADLVAFRKNPLADVGVLATSPELVMKGGVVVAGRGESKGAR
jgi:imidazolonepropionase-like amidohydrolase